MPSYRLCRLMMEEFARAGKNSKPFWAESSSFDNLNICRAHCFD